MYCEHNLGREHEKINYVLSPIQHAPHTHVVNGNPHGHDGTSNTLQIANTIFDPGSLESLPYLVRNLIAVNGSLSRDFNIALTHPHLDHIGATAELIDIIERHGGHATVFASKGIQDVISQADPLRMAMFLYPDRRFTPFEVDVELTDHDQFLAGGDIVVQAITAVGHSEYDLVFLVNDQGRKILVSGDALVGSGIDEERLGSNLDRFNETQSKIIEYDFDVIFEGHGNPHILLSKTAYKERLNWLVSRRSEFVPGFRGLWNSQG